MASFGYQLKDGPAQCMEEPQHDHVLSRHYLHDSSPLAIRIFGFIDLN
jgi:hypothetical protein